MSEFPDFPTDYETIKKRIAAIDPVKYGRTRNFVNGDVTYLSPYISRGFISTKMIFDTVIEKGYKFYEIEKFLKELAWRDYFQRVCQEKDVDKDIKQPQQDVTNHNLPAAIINAATDIAGIDNAIKTLYETGYMHNHCRMYTASVVCNVAHSHWRNPAQWMYYHLLDGDWASNACSWQWVAGSNSSKKYYANQENISRYTGTELQDSFLNIQYDKLPDITTPEVLMKHKLFEANTKLPETTALAIQKELPVFIYNYYNLDPEWHRDEPGNRILLLEPSHFSKYPVCHKCIEFMLALSKNINGIQIFTGEFDELLAEHKLSFCFYKEHPLSRHYRGISSPRDWISSEVTGYYPSFFAYWKKLEKEIKNKFN